MNASSVESRRLSQDVTGFQFKGDHGRCKGTKVNIVLSAPL